MKFRFDYLFQKKFGSTTQNLHNLKKNTGHGAMFRNYELAQQYINSQFGANEIIDIVECTFCDVQPTINNCFVIFESDYLPQSFISTIKRQTGLILVNSQWMRQVVLSQANCDPSRIIKLPYLQNFDKLNKYKRVNVQKDASKLTFYTIADYKDVKNLLDLFDAFNIAFQGQQDVQLIIKTSNAQFLQKGLHLRKLKNPKITIINQMLPEVEIYKLHMKGDIYISTAYCVGWQIPPFQASYFGKPLICGNHSAFTEWVDFDKAITLQSYKKQIPLRQYSNGRFKSNRGNLWLINMIQTQEIIAKLKYVYDNYNTIKTQYTDVTKFDVRNINYFIEKNKNNL